MRKQTDWLIVHCAATRPNTDIGAREIRQWHVRDNGWRDIGYHMVIRRSGALEPGRDLDDVGAHVAGHNSNSIGICLVGGVGADNKPESNFTPPQWATLEIVLRMLSRIYPAAKVRGHRDFAAKACPSFDVVAWAKAIGLPT